MNRTGFALIELVIAILVLALLTGISGVAIGALKPSPAGPETLAYRLARTQALRTGEAVRSPPNAGSSTVGVLFLPDGRAIGRGFDPWTGLSNASIR